MTTRGLWICLGLATAALALPQLGWAHGGEAGLAVLAGAGWVWLEVVRWKYAAGLGLGVFVGLAAWGVLVGVPAAGLAPAVVLALAAWDLARLRRRLQTPWAPESIRLVEIKHFRRLAWACGSGLALAELAALAHVALNFWVVFGLALAGLVGLYLVGARLSQAR